MYHTVDVPAEPEMAIVRGAYMMLKNSKASILAELNIDETPAAPAAEEEPTEA
ncbi:hypothetical protein JCM19237_276 [Photobacterium aphoticum]|uniref:Uncharacterized protein n=1 Tax=Photobacterium aphoticum TaxID=754436 RepID=A0A090QYE8_9GAMM|nr:hypothetical protein JCM19237_276 [Photobacterium aphoticum]